MSINKNAYLRYQVLDKCFSNQYKMFSIDDLLSETTKAMEEFNGIGSKIEKRQLYDDIRFMESESGWSIPLQRIRSGKKVYYRYSDVKFSILNQKISDSELDAINSALMVFHRFRGIPQFEWVNELGPKLQNLFKGNTSPEVISFEQNEYLRGIELLPVLYRAITNQLVLNIKYKSFKEKEAKEYLFHPYYLKQYNKRWFLLGLNDKNKEIQNMALDRIESINQSPYKYSKNVIDFNDYYEDYIGVTRQKNDIPIRIELLFNKDIAPYIITKPIHGSQKKIRESESGVVFEIFVVPNYELCHLILSFGDSLEVLLPLEYRRYIRNSVRKMAKKYEVDS